MSNIYSEAFYRINADVYYDKNYKPYKKSFLEEVLIHFEKEEEFEKCQIVKNFIDKRFNHEINYKNE